MLLSQRSSRSVVLACLGVLAMVPIISRNTGRDASQPISSGVATAAEHDFDFEFGRWVMHRRRLKSPLTGSKEWTESDGDLHMVRKVWDGQAALGELQLQKPAPHFAGSLFHLYNPGTHEWNLYWADASEGKIGSPPMSGRFANGRGEFFGADSFGGKPIRVRVVYREITANSFRTERAFSNDAGKTWEVNGIDSYTRIDSNPASDAIRNAAKGHRESLLQAAQLMPAGGYQFRPTPAQRSFGEIILHIRNDNRTTCNAIAARPAATGDKVSATEPKDSLVARLSASLSLCDSALATVTDPALGELVPYYGKQATRAQAMVGLVDDWSGHYSQLAMYLRLQGILPPTAR